jgi:hypothetical protein
MQGKMTVFGFGRKGLEAFHSHTNLQFSIALLETSEYKVISDFVSNLAKLTLTGVRMRTELPEKYPVRRAYDPL